MIATEFTRWNHDFSANGWGREDSVNLAVS
jgi:hypothetical protein